MRESRARSDWEHMASGSRSPRSRGSQTIQARRVVHTLTSLNVMGGRLLASARQAVNGVKQSLS